jgi:pimeloyl-ACP methyl ester carboxylesterase
MLSDPTAVTKDIEQAARPRAEYPQPDALSQEGTDMNGQPNIVLVHGALADSSSWSAVIERLQADGFRVTAPQSW